MGTGAGTWPIVHSDCRTQAIRARFRCRGRCVACDEDRHSCHRLQLYSCGFPRLATLKPYGSYSCMLFAQPPWGNVLKKSKPTFRPARPEIFGLLGEVKSDFP